MVSLQAVGGPGDLAGLSPEELADLADEIREFLVERVARTGGHLGPNLGVVELTIALHRVFDSPRDTLVFDTGHQAYVHKLLTGRQDFSGLRQRGGLSGYPSRAESEHDVVENSPRLDRAVAGPTASPRPTRCAASADRHVVAVIGDGALTGGMAWEALNNIAAGARPPPRHRRQRQRALLRPDHRRPGPPPRDAAHDAAATSAFLDWGKRDAAAAPARPGGSRYDALHGVKKGIKDVVAPQGMFEDLGLKYIGPVDGHDVAAGRARAAPGEGLRRPGDRARHHPEGPRLRARPRTTRPTGSTPSA